MSKTKSKYSNTARLSVFATSLLVWAPDLVTSIVKDETGLGPLFLGLMVWASMYLFIEALKEAIKGES